MKYKIRTTNQFDKALVRCKKRNYPIDKLQKTITLLAETGVLPQEYQQHKLKGFKGNDTWECHVLPDWLLVWEQHEDELYLLMLNTGTHSDLF